MGKAHVIGVAMTRFGQCAACTRTDICGNAEQEALADCDLTPKAGSIVEGHNATHVPSCNKPDGCAIPRGQGRAVGGIRLAETGGGFHRYEEAAAVMTLLQKQESFNACDRLF